MRELRAAVDLGRPIVLVRETETAKGGLSIEELREQCPPDLREAVFACPVVRWLRLTEFHLASMRMIAETLLTQMISVNCSVSQSMSMGDSMYIAGEAGGLGPVVSLLAEPLTFAHNSSAKALVEELTVMAKSQGRSLVRRRSTLQRLSLEGINGRLLNSSRTAAVGDSTNRRGSTRSSPLTAPSNDVNVQACYILLLHKQVFEELALADEIRLALEAGHKIVLVQDCSTSFDTIIARTPPALIGMGLYEELAVPLEREGEHRRVSICLVAAKVAAAQQPLQERLFMRLMQRGSRMATGISRWLRAPKEAPVAALPESVAPSSDPLLSEPNTAGPLQ